MKMVNKVINSNAIVLAVLMCSFSCLSFAQSKSNTEKQVQFVFDQLISVYGSAKSTPELKIDKFVVPASYSSKPNATIKIDIGLYKICQTFGKDSLNALSIVISHELTHYFNDHTFCTDYAFANLKTNPKIKSAIGKASYNSRIEKESESDIKGYFFAAAAGFQPHGLQGQLIDKIYKAYNLSDIQNGYPSRQERKVLAQSAEKAASELYGDFKKGLLALENKQYDDAIKYFTNANGKIPFRENLNNIGVARARKALLLKVKTSEEYKFPDRFLYPLEVENSSRLNDLGTRGTDNRQQLMTDLLTSAQKDFQEAIRLDPKFTKGYINLACVLDLLGDSLGSISLITKQLQPIEKRDSIEAQRILAIAYFHSNVKEYKTKAEEIWSVLKM